MRDRWSSFVAKRANVLILAVYAFLTVVMTWPVIARLTTHVPGGTVDLWTHRWTYWWIKHAIAEGHNPFHTDLLFYPQGVSLAFHNIAWVNIFVWLPLQTIVDGDTAYSLTFLILTTLNGFAMYVLLHDVVGSVPAAFVGGLIYGFWPYTMSQFGHPNMKVTCWIPLALLYLRRTLVRRRVRDALLAGIFLALIGLTRWQLLLMAAMLFALYILWEFLRKGSLPQAHLLGLLALTGLIAGALMAPLAAPVASAFLARDDASDVLFTEEVSGQTDLLAYVLPTPYHPFWNGAVERLYENFIHNKLFIPFLGYTTIALAVYGAVRRWKQARFWLLVAGLYVALALGPQLRVNGQLYPGIPMPYRLIGDLFIVRALRVPNRFNLLLALPVAMLATLGVATLIRKRSRAVSAILIAALAAVILREYSLVPYHTERPVAPNWYARLGREDGEFAVLDLPMGLQTYNKRYMFYQITHRKPLVEGKVARPPREAFAFLESTRFLRQLLERNVMDPALVDVSSQLGILDEANVRYVVLHKRFASSEQLVAWRDWMTFQPVHEDEDLVVYRTDPQWPRDFDFSHNLTESVGLIRTTASPTETVQGAVVRVGARWGSSGPVESDYDVCLTLVTGSGVGTEPQCMPLSSARPTSQWEADEVVRSSYVLRLPLSLEPGDYSLVMSLLDGANGSPAGRRVRVGELRVAGLQPAQWIQAVFGDHVRLRGYDLRQSPDVLSLTLFWQALSEMDSSYKVFVHLTDPVSGEIVAQVDTVPRQWTYPTNQWIKGEVVRDVVRLPLQDVPPGQYALLIGWYDPVTGRRLPTYGSQDERYPGDALSVTPVEVE